MSGYCYSSGSCLSTQTDINNCGSFGKVCRTSKVSHSSSVSCTSGTCKATACTSPYTLNNGACVCPSGTCDTGSTCVSTQTNMDNCGSCGNVCNTSKVSHSSNVTCTSGSCKATACTSPYALNNGTCNDCVSGYCYSSGSCLSTQTDMNNCGSCGTVCNTSKVSHSSSVSCTSGSCKATACTSPYTLSNGACVCPSGTCDTGSTCVSTQTDMSNCGSCGNVCDTSKVSHSSTVTCTGGNCEATGCTSPYVLNSSGACVCASGYCDTGSTCVSTQTNMSNCGSCGNVCNTSKVSHSSAVTCTGGSCKATACTSPYVLDNGACVECINDTHKCENSMYYTCTNNSWGNGTACQAPTHGSATCDESTGCGIACDSGYCPRGTNCVSILTDMYNCGGCGDLCNLREIPFAVSVDCVGGQCRATECDIGFQVNPSTYLCDEVSLCLSGVDCLGDGSVCCDCALACPNSSNSGAKKPQCKQVSCP